MLEQLLSIIKNEPVIYLQTHDFPDQDAVASAFAMQQLLKHFSVESRIIYEGEIQRGSLLRLIDCLNIQISHASVYHLSEKDKIIIVDGCKGNKNVTDLIGDEIAVIDHHQVKSPEDVPFYDIRPDYGACSSIIYSYFHHYDIEIPRNTATALITGLLVDTLQLTRGVSEEDVTAYAQLYRLADINLVNSILRNTIQKKDLSFYRRAIERVEIQNRYAFCYFDEGCSQNLMGIIGDFFLSLMEVDFVLLCAKNKNKINFSVRSEELKWNSALIIKELLNKSGFGGGHADMAGGIIPKIENFDLPGIRITLKELLN